MNRRERNVMLTLSCLLVTIATTLSFPAQSDTRGFDDISPFDTDELNSKNGMREFYDDYASLPQKRGPELSVNQDLMSIASMLRNEAGRRKMEAAQSFLTRIGKRSDPSNLELSPADRYILSSLPFLRQTRGRLSVNMPLDALSQMIETQRRQQFDGRVSQINRKLSRLG